MNKNLFRTLLALIALLLISACSGTSQSIFNLKKDTLPHSNVLPSEKLVISSRLYKPITRRAIDIVVLNISNKPVPFKAHYSTEVRLTHKSNNEYILEGPFQRHPDWLNPGDTFIIEKYLPFKMEESDILSIDVNTHERGLLSKVSYLELLKRRESLEELKSRASNTVKLLSSDEAFKISAIIENNKILLKVAISEKHFIERDSVKITLLDDSSGLNFGKVILPESEYIRGDWFNDGAKVVYKNDVLITIPVINFLYQECCSNENALGLIISYLGGHDVGVVYPPVTKRVYVEIPVNITRIASPEYKNDVVCNVELLSNLQYNGSYRCKYLNGNKFIEGCYIDGRREGLWREWYKNKNLKSEVFYNAGGAPGEESTYNKKGELLFKSNHLSTSLGGIDSFRKQLCYCGSAIERKEFLNKHNINKCSDLKKY